MVASVTTSNEAWARNPHAPFGFAAARGRLRRCRSSAMSRIALVAGRPERYLDRLPIGGNPHTYGVAPDGRRILTLTYSDTVSTNQLPSLVLNWAAEVERLTSKRN